MLELSWLLSRDYSMKASLKLVGDRHRLRDRQRKALHRCAASDRDCANRARRQVLPQALAGETLMVDGYNVLLTVEAALSGGVLLLGRDGALRDLAAMSHHYRRLQVTRQAVEIIARYLDSTDCDRVIWNLDRPISNSGRLKKLIEEAVATASSSWSVELSNQTDRLLREAPHIVATADSVILDSCARWFNLARHVVSHSIPGTWVVDLSS